MPCLDDSDKEKWVYREHTRVKHELLQKYLRGWMPILGKRHPRIVYVDGFAGRGEYSDGSAGSPIIAMRVAAEVQKKFGYPEEVVCINIERNRDNYENLVECVKQEVEKCPIAKVHNICGEFAQEVSEMLRKVRGRLAPSFFFIDPFGFSGVPFSVIADVLSIPRTEVFLTFMTRDMSRFLDSSAHEKIYDALFGTSEWRGISSRCSGIQREYELLALYRRQLHRAANVKYTWPFNVHMAEQRRTIYYLMHATNHFLGLKLMKDIMYNQGAKGIFSYLGPEEELYGKRQKRLFEFDNMAFKRFLLERLEGRNLSYDEVMRQTYMDTPFVDKDYRKALKELEQAGSVRITRFTSRKTGLSGEDRISFPKIR
jgi:three-Cys-motif partner protein